MVSGRRGAMIEKYEFGSLIVDGKEYHSDVIILPEAAPGGQRVDANWWRKEGHRLDKADVDKVTGAKPEVLVVGTGYYGRMKVPEETAEFLSGLGIELYAQPTKEACQKYNELEGTRKVAAALHLTC
jgi:hypothetical protein